MRKILSALGACVLMSSISINLISCKKPEKNIHTVIKNVLSEPIEYYDDWIIDYSKINVDDMIGKYHVREKTVRFLEMLANNLIRKKLENQIYNFNAKYPNFTSSVILIMHDTESYSSDEEKLKADAKKDFEFKKNLFGKKEYSNVFEYYYNLNQLEDMDPEQIYSTSITHSIDNYNYFKKESLPHMHWGRGEYKYTYKKVLNNFKFKQKKFMEDPLKRLNYLQELINESSNIKALDKNFYKIVRVDNPSPARLYFSDIDFANKDILKNILQNNYLSIYELIKRNLKHSLTAPSTLLKYVLESMSEIFDDFDFDFEIEKVFTQNDVKDDLKLKMLLGDINGNDRADLKNSAILFRFKIWLIKDKIRSTNYIEDYLMGDIYYTNYY